MAKTIKAKARAIVQFLAISAAAGFFLGSQAPIPGARAKRSPKDLRIFQQYAVDVNEVVTVLRKEGLPAVDIFKGHKEARSPGGKRIMVVTDLKKNPNSIYRSPESRKHDEKDHSRSVSTKAGYPIINFLEQNPKAVSEKTMQRINALNRRYDKEIEPIFRKFDRKREASRTRRKIAFGTVFGGLAAALVASKDRDRRRKELIKRQRR